MELSTIIKDEDVVLARQIYGCPVPLFVLFNEADDAAFETVKHGKRVRFAVRIKGLIHELRNGVVSVFTPAAAPHDACETAIHIHNTQGA